MAPTQSGGYGSCDESSGEDRRPGSMPWFATHRIVYTQGRNESESIDVMAWDRGAEAPGPARYALYTQENAEAESEPEWAMDVEGRVWLRGEALPGGATAVVEEVWA
jgi:hypothetical protein